MLHTVRSYRGMVVAPHHLAAQAGLRVLEDGGNAIEAMIAAASTIAAVYPHMNGLGGDNFWLIHEDGEPVLGIEGCGGAAALANIDFYRGDALSVIPARGGKAALTAAGAVSGWQAALEIGHGRWGGRLPLDRLLEDAIILARDGVSVSRSLLNAIRDKKDQLAQVTGFAETYLTDGAVPEKASRFVQPRLAASLEQLARAGLDDFYRGDLASSMAKDLEAAGSPLRIGDFQAQTGRRVQPLTVRVDDHQLYNMPPPTQGLASLLLLGVYQRRRAAMVDTFEYVHNLVEATKQAFRIRDRYVTDPDYMAGSAQSYLTAARLDSMAAAINPTRAAPWPEPAQSGDTVWLGAVDGQGRVVSFIQSIYWEFGSGVVLNESGIGWQNRGTSFSLDPAHHNCLKPGRRPFHTIQPALARLEDGRVMAYGSMGGDGQPQTQSAIFTRHVMHGRALQASISDPRWLLGRTWGSEITNLRIENRFDPVVVEGLLRAGHDLDLVGEYDEIMGHAGALVRHPEGLIEGAADPRGNGQACGW